MTAVRKPFVLGITGTSLSTGRLSADWVARLLGDIRAYPECVGPIHIFNMGKGGWTSADILNGAPSISALKPNHIFFEGGAINDCFDGGAGPQISRPQHILNVQAMVAEWRANIPDVHLTIHTMSSVSAATAVGRPALADFYADEIATGTALGIETIDIYANWPTPLNPALTDQGDGLHPIWAGAVDTYFWPYFTPWVRTRMGAHWA